MNDEKDLLEKRILDFLEPKKSVPLNREKTINIKTGKPTANYYGNTYRVYKSFLSKFLNKYEEFSRESVNKWHNDMLEDGCKSSTYNLQLKILKGFDKYLRENDLIKQSPLSGYKGLSPVDKTHHKVLKKTTVKKIMDMKDNKGILAHIKFCLRSGVRLSELMELANYPYDPVTRVLVIKGKGGKIRQLTLDEKANKQLELIKSEPITDSRKFDRTMKKFLEVNNLEIFSAHSMRATYASILYSKDSKNLPILKNILGHASIDQTMEYIVSLRKCQPTELLDIGY